MDNVALVVNLQHTQAWRVLSQFFAAWLTGGIPMLASTLLLVAQCKQLQWLRHGVLFVLVGFYLFLSYTFLLSSPFSVAWITYTMIATVFAFLLFANQKYEL